MLKLFLFVLWACFTVAARVDDNESDIVNISHSRVPRILQYRQTLALPPVVWRAPIGCDNSGFFIEILAFFTGLVPFFEQDKLFLDIGRCIHFDTFTDKDTSMLKALQTSFITAPPAWNDSIVIHHKLPGQAVHPSLSSSRYLVGRMMTEASVLSRTELQQSKVMDEIWVPTPFHVKVFAAHGVPAEKLHVVPEAVDVQFYSALPRPQRGTARVFRFLSIFKYEQRKGADALLSAYWQTFQKEDNVELVIRSYKPSWEPGSADLNKVFNSFAVKKIGRPMAALAPVVWLQQEVSKHELRALYLSADVFVLPSRGEGWCLPCAEALAAGVPLIVTNFSGPSSYLSPDHSYPLRHAPQLNPDGTAEPDSTHLSELMRHVVTRQEELGQKSVSARLFAAKQFDPTAVALKVIKRLNAINNALLAEVRNAGSSSSPSDSHASEL